MKKTFLAVLAVAALMCACDKYDDSALKEQISNIEQRLSSAEESIEALQSTLADAVKKSLTVTVTEVEGGSKLTFSDGTSIVVKNGSQGPQGPEGPQGPSGAEGISIKENSDSYEFTVGDETYIIKKTADSFQIKASGVHFTATPGQKITVSYSISGGDESTIVCAEAGDGLDITLDKANSKLVIATGETLPADAYVILSAIKNNTGASSKQYITVEKFVIDNGEEMVLVPGGTFTVGEGAVHTDAGANTWKCTLPDYYIARTEVTQSLWAEVMGTDYLASQLSDGQKPEGYICYPVGAGDYIPQPYINWFDAIIFCNKLSILRGAEPCYSIGGKTNPADWNLAADHNSWNWEASVVCDWTKNGFRLPALPEWEFAAGGGEAPLQVYPGCDDYSDLGLYGNIEGALPGGATEGLFKVAQKLPNKLGIFDMAGNATEWVWELWFEYPGGERTYYADVITYNYGARKAVKRGGTCWNWNGQVYLTTSNWEDPINDHNWPCGMRLARTCVK